MAHHQAAAALNGLVPTPAPNVVMGDGHEASRSEQGSSHADHSCDNASKSRRQATSPSPRKASPPAEPIPKPVGSTPKTMASEPKLTESTPKSNPPALTGAELPSIHNAQAIATPPETLWQRAERVRRETMNNYRANHEAWQSWRDGYGTLLQQHRAGINPGFPPTWKANWTQEEFDIQHLAQAWRLSQRVSKTETILLKVIGAAKKLNLEPLDWQTSQFPDQPHYYTESQENDMITRAPANVIYEWGSHLPDDPCDFGQLQLNTADIPVGDAGYHTVEYPDDMDLEPDRDVEVWDSFSLPADRFTRPLIDQVQPTGPPQWTQTSEQRPLYDNSKVLHSHFF